MLRQRPLDERGNVCRRVADRPKAVRHVQPLHEPGDPIGEHGARVLSTDARHVGAKRLGVSPRTYAAYVADLKSEFEVETRFQLGYEMGKRGISGRETDESSA